MKKDRAGAPRAISRGFGKSVDWLLRGEGSKERPHIRRPLRASSREDGNVTHLQMIFTGCRIPIPGVVACVPMSLKTKQPPLTGLERGMHKVV